jgi:predicted protein tyrosine phosphatase
MIINLNSKMAGSYSTYKLSDKLDNFLKDYETQRKFGFRYDILDKINALDKIDDRLYLGGEHAASNYEIIRKNKISHIINVAINSTTYDHSDIKIVKCQIDDEAIAPDGYFESMANLLYSMLQDTNDIENILVHCVAGISRSATVILSYLILHQKMSFYAALSKIEKNRDIVSPHPLLIYSMLRDFGDRIELEGPPLSIVS